MYALLASILIGLIFILGSIWDKYFHQDKCKICKTTENITIVSYKGAPYAGDVANLKFCKKHYEQWKDGE